MATMRAEAVGLLITNGTIITMDPDRRILYPGAVAVRGHHILAVGPPEEVAPQLQRPHIIDASGKVVLPGLINTHTHLFQTLLKGPGDDRKLEDWFRNVVGPASCELTEEDCYLGAIVGCLEGLRSGTTTIKDFMYPHPRPKLSDAVIRAMIETGVRGVFVRGYLDYGLEYGVPAPLIQPLDDILQDCERIVRKYHRGANGRILIRIGPCMIWSCTVEGLQATQRLAADLEIGQTMHIAETPFSVENALQRFGVGDLALLERIGFLDSDTLAVHCVYLTDRDLRILRSRGVSVSHNPTSNMYLGSGVAPIPQMLMAGIAVGLGTDGPASNNNQNMIEALKFAALLHKVHTKDPTAMTAEQALEMATIGAAKSLGIDRDVGSLEPGKRADIVIADLRKVHAAPVHHPVSTLVYAATGGEVETVIVDGQVVMENGKVLTVNEWTALEDAQRAADDLMRRAKIPRLRDRGWRPFAF